MDATDDNHPAERKRAGHRKLSLGLVVLATVLAVVAIFSIWANRQALNTDNWAHTSEKLLANQKIDEQLSNYLAAQFVSHDNLRTTLEAELPEQLKPLGAAASAGLHQIAPRIAERALENPDVQALWVSANRLAHERLLEVLDGGGSAVSTENGVVTLDLGALVEQVGKEIGVEVGVGVAENLPPEAGRLVILKSDQLSAAQSGAKLIRTLPVVLTLLVLILYGLAIWLAGPRRREALRSAGFGLAVAGALVLTLRGVGGHILVDSLVANDASKPAVEAVWSIATSLLVTVAASALAFGILVFLAAWLAGPTRLATTLRREAAPYVRDQPVAAGLAALLLWLALVAWVPIAAFRKPLGILFFLVLFAAGAELLRRQTRREFPDAQAGDIGVSFRAHLAARSRPSSPAPGAAAAIELDQLERLSALHRDGDLTDAQFEAAKSQVLRA